MKKLGWLLVVVLAMALGAGMAFAQSSVNRVTAHVPFAFFVGKTELPAGYYEVYQPVDTALDLVIRNMDTGKAIVLPVMLMGKTNDDQKAELMFKKVDDRSYLWEIVPRWADGWEVAGLHVKNAPSAASLPKASVAGE